MGCSGVDTYEMTDDEKGFMCAAGIAGFLAGVSLGITCANIPVNLARGAEQARLSAEVPAIARYEEVIRTIKTEGLKAEESLFQEAATLRSTYRTEINAYLDLQKLAPLDSDALRNGVIGGLAGCLAGVLGVQKIIERRARWRNEACREAIKAVENSGRD